jgi:hypothetical protein
MLHKCLENRNEEEEDDDEGDDNMDPLASKMTS